jgi:hypothetical protein
MPRARAMTAAGLTLITAATAALTLVSAGQAQAAVATYVTSGPFPIGSAVETSNGPGVVIKDGFGSTPTASEPYGSVAPVTGLTGTVTDVDPRIKGFTHQAPTDVDASGVGSGGA